MHAFTSVAALCSAAVMMATSASASTLSSVPPSHLRFRRAVVSVTPTSPGPGETFNEGAQCTTEWTPGQGNNWKSMTISLMTGSNEDMTVLTSVATGIDGTSLSSYTWTCPEVSPNSAIYFYQFTDRNSANPTWTTRFTIASADGSSTKPTESEQADGQTVLYGNGQLVSGGSSGSSSSSGSGSSTTSTSSSSGSDTGSSSSSNTSAAGSDSSSTSTEPAATSYTFTQASSATTSVADSTGSTMTTSQSFPTVSSSSSSSGTSSNTSSGAAPVHVVRAVSIGMAVVAAAFLVAL